MGIEHWTNVNFLENQIKAASTRCPPASEWRWNRFIEMEGKKWNWCEQNNSNNNNNQNSRHSEHTRYTLHSHPIIWFLFLLLLLLQFLGHFHIAPFKHSLAFDVICSSFRTTITLMMDRELPNFLFGADKRKRNQTFTCRLVIWLKSKSDKNSCRKNEKFFTQIRKRKEKPK